MKEDMSVDLSVILLTGAEPDHAAPALQSILEQEFQGSMEVLLVRVGWTGEEKEERSSGALVRHIPVPEPDSFGALRARVVHACRGRLIAFLENHCVAAPGWARAMVAAHEGPWAGVGPEVHNGNPGRGISDAVALMNYTPWLPPARAGEAEMLPGHNASYKAQVLRSYGAELDWMLRSDSALNMKLVEDGHRLYVEPRARIAHANEHTLRSILFGYYTLNRSLAATRAELFGWSVGQRAFRALLWPLVPLRRWLQLVLELRKTRPDLIAVALRWSPVMLLAWSATGLGQALGVVFGAGTADIDFLMYEVSEHKSVIFTPWTE